MRSLFVALVLAATLACAGSKAAHESSGGPGATGTPVAAQSAPAAAESAPASTVAAAPASTLPPPPPPPPEPMPGRRPGAGEVRHGVLHSGAAASSSGSAWTCTSRTPSRSA